jgi:predicted MPP superfamily phosphohydrolase
MPAPQERSEDTPAAHMPVRIRRFLLSLIPLLGLLHAYIGWRLLPALSFDVTGWVIGLLILCASTLLLPLGLLARFLFSRPALVDRVTWAGSLTMGLFSSVFVLTLLREPLLLVADIAGVTTITTFPNFSQMTAIAVLVSALLLTLIGFVNARRIARVVRVDIPLDDLPPALNGFTIAQLSDIHVGATIKRDYVAAIVDRVNSLGADLIAITGDVVDGSVSELAPHTAPLARLKARHGAYVVTGNHEYYSGATAWMEEFRRIGLHGLSNEHVVIAHDGARLVLAGVTDYSAGAFDPSQRSDPLAALRGSPAGVPRLLLAHQPRSATAAAAAGFDLQLSGHTHGGQFWPWNLFVTLQQPFTAGLHRLGRLWVYTSRGTGYWGPPKRFGAASEITLLRLVTSVSN